MAEGRWKLVPRATVAATTTGSLVNLEAASYTSWIFTLKVFSAERDTANETYDIYIQASDGKGTWDVVHFPQIASIGAKTYVARVSSMLPMQTVTTATPGVAAYDPGCLKVDTATADQGTRTLTAGMVRHGPIPDQIRAEIVIAGTVATGIDFEILVTALP